MEDNMNHEEVAENGLPSLIKCISSNEVAGFDKIKDTSDFQVLSIPGQESQTASAGREGDGPEVIINQTKHFVSVSIPLSSEGVQSKNSKRVIFGGEMDVRDYIPNSSSDSSTVGGTKLPNTAECYSQPMSKGHVFREAVNDINFSTHPSINVTMKDNRYNNFKTWSGRLERQITILLGKSPGPAEQDDSNLMNKDRPLPVDRYLDALEGPELETLRASEEIVLPHDSQWPFLLRFPISSFSICLGVSSQAILWKTLATAVSTEFLQISLKINLILWFISIALVATFFTIYLLKIIFYFEAVRREYYHPIRVSFFFAPWVALLLLVLGVPPSVTKDLHHALWYILMIPIFCLELKIYEQWMSGGPRSLSKVANPSNHLSVVGNFVGALLGASMGLKEGPIFFFAIGLVHYTVVFVTLYQTLPTNETLPKELHPVFFLFVVPPSVTAMAWAKIQGSFDHGSRIAYFIAMFLYFSLIVRVKLFRGFKFSLAWWAYTFPMTSAATATIRYSDQVTNVVTQALCVMLCLISTLTVAAIFLTTIFHAFVLQDLFPNDIAIAISDRKRKPHHRKLFHLRRGNHEHSNEIENCLKFTNSDSNDLEACQKDTCLDFTLDTKNMMKVFPSEH